MISRRTFTAAILASFLAGAGLTLAAVSTKPVMHSSVFNWADLKVVPTKIGTRRTVFDNPTPALGNFECHITTLNPGESPHPPHHHPDEELMIIKDGTLEALQGEHTNIVTAGGIIFEASNELHGLRNVGATPATYYVFRITPHDLATAK
jgi:quercetin dioxygenase-like cupin family protein